MQVVWERARARGAETAVLVLAGLFAAYQLQVALKGPLVDWNNVWVAAHALLDGRPPYGEVVGGGDYVRPPFSTVVFAPVALLPERLSGQLVVLLNVVGLVVGLVLAAKAQRARGATLVLALFAVSLSVPFEVALLTANVDALTLAPFGGAMLAMRARRWTLAGILIGVTLAVKPSFVAFALAPLLLGSVLGTVVALITTVSLSLLALLLIPEGGRFITEVVPFLLGGHTAGVNYSLKGTLQTASMNIPEVVSPIARALALAGIAYVATRARPLLRSDPGAGVVLLFCATVLLSGYFLVHYCLVLLLGIGLVEKVKTVGQWVTLAVSAYLLLSADVLRSSIGLVDLLGTGRYVLGSILLLGLLVSISSASTAERRLAGG